MAVADTIPSTASAAAVANVVSSAPASVAAGESIPPSLPPRTRKPILTAKWRGAIESLTLSSGTPRVEHLFAKP